MEQTRKSKKVIMIGAIVLVVLVAVFALVYAFVLERPAAGSKAIHVQVVHSENVTHTFDIKTDASYLRQALEEQKLVSGKESATGLFVQTVDGQTADDTKQEWWCFTQSGQTLMTGVDTTPIKDGDQFEITLTTGY